MSEQVDHADYDSNQNFLLYGVKKGKLLFQKGRKSTSMNWVKNHVSEQVDHAEYNSGSNFFRKNIFLDHLVKNNYKFELSLTRKIDRPYAWTLVTLIPKQKEEKQKLYPKRLRRDETLC